MPHFAYTAVDAQGKTHQGTVEANSAADAAAAIKKQGRFPTNIAETAAAAGAVKGKGLSLPFSFGGGSGTGKVPAKVLTVFTRQLSTLISAGLPLLRSLRTLSKQEKNANLKKIMASLAESVEGGTTFSEALAQHPKAFNKLYVNMVKAGELGGVLEVVLTRLAEFAEKSQRIRGKVTSAMVYPIVVLTIAVGIVTFLMLFIVPKFEAIFKDMLGGRPLPFITQTIMDISRFIQGHFFLLAGMLVLAVVGLRLSMRLPGVPAKVDQFKLKLPLFGDMLTKTAVARFSRTLGTLVSSGVPILQALQITRDTAGNERVSSAIDNIHDNVKEGESMVSPMEASQIFPPMVVSMVQVGEETGQLPDMLTKVADVFEEEVDTAVAGLTSLLEPVMIVLLALIVGTIVVALFLPLITIIQDLTAGG
ncbi:MAG: type II secretion system protein GspF [Verrucomicrobia bacterium]|nr:type II secretion system protein GspF [Verrucomicrobiota bacterium]NDB99876.1 type II secretion system protein GspF [Verrucomicrobiota bacterium]NDF16597.1 type II secretion system protein GspF [Verrucomicrobiota bacterium]